MLHMYLFPFRVSYVLCSGMYSFKYGNLLYCSLLQPTVIFEFNSSNFLSYSNRAKSNVLHNTPYTMLGLYNKPKIAIFAG